tara:strand:- start:447 stop:641 length:195 start_codon:yes stop_codon:yes gene_type:complete
MGSLMFLGSVVGVGLVVWWALKNDDVGDVGETSGLLAMRHRTEEAPVKKPPSYARPAQPPVHRP